MSDVGGILFMEKVNANEGVTDESMSGDHHDPWNTESGEGHLDELHKRVPRIVNSASDTIIHPSDY